MKKIKLLLFLLALPLGISSCSSDSGDSGSSSGESFTLTYNGQTKTVSAWQALKEDGLIDVTGNTADGIGINFKFNPYGNLYQAFTYPSTAASVIESQEASAYFSENTFTFELVDINTTNKTIRVNFNGKVYDDKYDHTSNFVIVSGSFKLIYTEIPAVLEGLGTSAQINGEAWHGLAFTSSSSTSNYSTVLNVANGSEYEIGISYAYYAPATGTFSFTSLSENKRITFSKYDVATHSMIEYNVNGTITYTIANSTYVEGTFSLIATHPTNGSTITITNGVFKEGSAT
ncbi:MAG: DUF6252 family protein [Bacteroidota bacterium]